MHLDPSNHRRRERAVVTVYLLLLNISSQTLVGSARRVVFVANYCKNTDSTQIRAIVWIVSCINEEAWSKIDASCTTQGYLSVHALQLPRFRFFFVMKKVDFCVSHTTPFVVMETQENREKLWIPSIFEVRELF